jgi:hypothetical protein
VRVVAPEYNPSRRACRYNAYRSLLCIEPRDEPDNARFHAADYVSRADVRVGLQLNRFNVQQIAQAWAQEPHQQPPNQP